MPAPADVAHALYGTDLADFVAARSAAAADLRGEDAAAVKALRKPTVAAWAVNQLVRVRPELVDAIVQVGDDLRAAQADRDALRELDQRRRSATSAAVQATVEVTGERGRPVAGAALEGVESTLRAVALDPDAAEQVQAGCLTQALAASGFGVVASAPAAPSRGSARPAPARPRRATATSSRKKGPDPERVAEAERQLAGARATLEAARTAADAADEAVDVLAADVEMAEESVAELRAALAAAEDEHRTLVARLADQRNVAAAADAVHQAAELAVASAERDRDSLHD